MKFNLSFRSPISFGSKKEPKKTIRTVVVRNKRNYHAAQTKNSTFGWTTVPKPINNLLRESLTILKARSRSQGQGNDYGKRFLGLLKQNVIGHAGVTLNAKAKGFDLKPDKLANTAIQNAWKIWGKAKNCSLTGNLSWIDIQNQYIMTLAEDGEYLARKYRGVGDFNFVIQPLDTQLLDPTYYKELPNGRRIRMGIEFNKVGRPIAYHLLTARTEDSYMFADTHYVRVPAEEIIHDFLPERVSQIRGIPWLSTPLERMKMLDGYEDAALVNARAGASKTMIIEDDGTGAGQFEGDESDDTPDSEDDEVIEEIEAGVVEYLPKGKKIAAFDPTYPSGEFAQFVKGILRGIAAGLNISYNTLANDLEGVSFASGRIGVLEDREAWRCLQTFVIERLCSEVYSEWLQIQLGTGNLKVPTKTGEMKSLRLTNMQKFLAIHWAPKRWAYVDPLKEAKSAEVMHSMNARSVSDIIRENGGDPESTYEEIAAEKILFNELGIGLESKQPATAEEAAKQKADDDALAEEEDDENKN